jgi:hypothetical protein
VEHAWLDKRVGGAVGGACRALANGRLDDRRSRLVRGGNKGPGLLVSMEGKRAIREAGSDLPL